MEKEKKVRKMNNGGFSLVELIIVVAIMAILIGVLAPQYMRYVERSRQSTDMQNVAAIVSAIQIYSADPEVAATDRIADGETIVIANAGVTLTATQHIDEALALAGIDTTGLALQSSTWNGATGSITLTVTVAADGTVAVTSNDAAIGVPTAP